MEKFIQKANVLIEAIPYIHAFRRKVFVVKYGGSILDDANIRRNVFEDLVFLSYVGIRTILVHGGGPYISARLKASGKKAEFHNGIRVTDKETLTIVMDELDKLNKQIVSEIKALKGDVTGLRGDENIIHVQKKASSKDLGFVGTITKVDKAAIEKHLKKGFITVVSPLGISAEKKPHNVNADEVGSAIAASLQAEKFVVLTNVPGVMRDMENRESLISSLTVQQIEMMIKEKIIQGGMIPKVQACLTALHGGVRKTHIIDARIRHALLLEIFTDRGVGTQIITEEQYKK